MTTYSVREFKARLSEILRSLEDGEEVIITRRGKPCGRLTAMLPGEQKPSLRTLRGAYADVLPDATYQDFLDIKSIWEPRLPPDEEEHDGAG